MTEDAHPGLSNLTQEEKDAFTELIKNSKTKPHRIYDLTIVDGEPCFTRSELDLIVENALDAAYGPPPDDDS